MTLHLQKLCVGAESIEDLESWIESRMNIRRAEGRPLEQRHTTRMMPQKRDELLAGGSLYWVIKGSMLCRQRLLDIQPFKDDEGISRCDLVLEPRVVRVAPRPKRPFQGWRYLDAASAPPDLVGGVGEGEALPADLAEKLQELGLL